MVEQQNEGVPLIDPSIVGSAEPAAASGASQDGADNQKRKQPTAAELKPGQYCWGTGRRKCSVARVRVRPGEGNMLINGRALEAYFTTLENQNTVKAPLEAAESAKRFDVFVNVKGGGLTGQAGAALLGLTRALIVADPDTFTALRDAGYLTRDSRMVERKKYGQKGARKRFQFSKR